MQKRLRRGAVLLGAAALGAAAVCWQPGPVHAANAPVADGGLALYNTRVQPIFQANCYRCHGGMNRRGGFQMDTREGMLRGGHDGNPLVPGHPEQSLLVRLIRHEGPAADPMPMPPKSKLSDDDIAAVTEWVREGAAMPAQPAAAH